MEKIEILFLLQRGERSWSAEEITRELRSSVLGIQGRLDELERCGLVRRESGGTYAFESRSPDAPLVPELAALFARKPFTVMNFIHQSPTDKIRTFADAFRFKEPRKDEGPEKDPKEDRNR